METSVRHLIVVCCHGIWLGGPSNGHDESEWLIAGFQKGETPTFIKHARAGVDALVRAERGNAALCFSGGPTREETRLSEAQSYANIVEANDYFGHSDIMSSSPSFLIEDRALDSYHNVLFSLTLFYSHYGAWPSHLTIVSHAFKKPRLVDHHCAAIGFRLDQVSFIGIDPPGLDTTDVGIGVALEEWKEDPHGRGDSLRGKRQRRNPWNRTQSAFDNEDESPSRGGLITTGHSDEETLVDDASRPW